MRHDGEHRLAGPVPPGNVDRIGPGDDQRGAGLCGGVDQAVERIRRQQLRIVTDPPARQGLLRKPAEGARIHEIADREQARRELLLHLQRVAAVDENDGAVEKDEGGAGRAGEARRPGETLVAGGQVFVLILVVVRDVDAIKPLRLQRGAQQRQRGLTDGWSANDFVGLSHVCASNRGVDAG